MQLVVSAGGTIRCLYDESIELAAFGSLSISRGSFVEPTTDGQWLCDLSPVNGPMLGPFLSRSQALAAEVNWLEVFWLSAKPVE
jgi:hypothetical protein